MSSIVVYLVHSPYGTFHYLNPKNAIDVWIRELKYTKNTWLESIDLKHFRRR